MVELNKIAAGVILAAMNKEPAVRTTVLIPESLYAKLKEIAERERRSAHKQIIVALEQFVAEDQREQSR